MDEELESLAAQALCNAFWHDFSALVNKYLKMGKGLDTDLLEIQIGELANIYGRNHDEAAYDTCVTLWTENATFNITKHDTIVEALEFEAATEVHLNGTKVFEKYNEEWCIPKENYW